MANMELVNETLDWLIEHSERHYQGSFVGEAEYRRETNEYNFCETTFCMAGAALMLKNRLIYKKDTGRVFTDNDMSMEWLARELLEFNQWQMTTIFYSGDFDSPLEFKNYVLAALAHEHTEDCGDDDDSNYYDCQFRGDFGR